MTCPCCQDRPAAEGSEFCASCIAEFKGQDEQGREQFDQNYEWLSKKPDRRDDDPNRSVHDSTHMRDYPVETCEVLDETREARVKREQRYS